MEFEILENKKLDGDKINLLSNYFKIDYDKVSIQDWVIIDDSTILAIDLICQVAYGNPSYLDLLLKFNRMSSALDIGIGQIIAIPDMNSLIKNSRYIDLTKSEKSKSIISDKQKVSALVNPTTKPIPSSNYTKVKGNFIF